MIQEAVIYAKVLERLVAFYSVLGFETEEIIPEEYAILISHSTEINIVAIPEQIAKDIEITSPPKIRSETPVKLSFIVKNIVHALKQFGSLGGQAKGEQWEFRGHLIQDVIDPEGYVFQIKQPKLDEHG